MGEANFSVIFLCFLCGVGCSRGHQVTPSDTGSDVGDHDDACVGDRCLTTECLINNGGCDANATCTVSSEGRLCACNTGFVGDGIRCMPMTLSNWQMDAFLKAANTGENDLFGTSVAISGDGATLAVGAAGEDELQTESGAVYVYTRVGTRWTQQAFLKASNAGENDRFGTSVTISSDGNTLAVGARGEDSRTVGINGVPNELETESGAVYVFVRTGTTWRQQAFVKASNPGGDDEFGSSVALSDDGSTLAVGAHREDSSRGDTPDESARRSGAVYVYTRAGTTWRQQAYLKAMNPGVDDRFGHAVALSGDGNTLAVGVRQEDNPMLGVPESLRHSGAVCVFSRTDEAWVLQAFIKASNADHADEFGVSVSLSNDGNTLAVGAWGENSSTTTINGPVDESALDSGAVYIFARAGISWAQQAFVKASNADEADAFGTSVALSADGDTLAVGARGEDSGISSTGDAVDESARYSGAAYVFTRTGVTWNQQAFVKASNTGQSDWFGVSVTLSSDGAVLGVGAVHEDSATTGVDGAPDESATDSGAVYVYTR